jgi:hypothetical protein
VSLRRTLLMLLVVLAAGAGRAEALNIRDLIELSKAGLSDSVLIALIEVDHGVFSIDTDTLKNLKANDVSDAVIVALIRSGRTAPPPAAEPVALTSPAPAAAPDVDSSPREPQVIVIDHHDQAPAQQAMYPVGVVVPGLYPGYARPGFVNPGVTRATGITGFGNTGFNNTGFNNTSSANSGFDGRRRSDRTVTTILPTDQGLVKARVPVPPNCVAAQPVFWGFGGKLRPDSWQPPPTVVCR